MPLLLLLFSDTNCPQFKAGFLLKVNTNLFSCAYLAIFIIAYMLEISDVIDKYETSVFHIK